jgi:arylformamidase
MATEEDLPSDVVKGAIAVSGIYDLAPLTSTSMQEDFRFTPADIEAMSPLRLLPHEAAPLLLAVGEDETRTFRTRPTNTPRRAATTVSLSGR